MRLIDADAFKEYIKNGFQDATNLFKNEECREVSRQITDAFCLDIDEQPTAYDDIIKQLEDNRQAGYNHGHTVGYNEAVADFVNMFKSKTTMENNLVEEIAEQLTVNDINKVIKQLEEDCKILKLGNDGYAVMASHIEEVLKILKVGNK